MIELAFPANYDLEVISELRAQDDESRLFFPGADSEGDRDGLTIGVSAASRRWVGTFELGRYKPSGLTGVFSLPNPDHFCVIAEGAGYVVRASDPDQWESIDVFPVIDARALKDHHLLVLVDFTTMAAYGPEGFAWRTRRLSWDGIRIIATKGNKLWARVWDAPSNGEATVAVDLRTGLHRGGAAPPHHADEAES